MKSLLFIVCLFTISACQGDRFEPFALVNKVRIMAVKSSAPELRPNMESELSALVHIPDGVEATYKWEWCPFRTNAVDQFDCPLTKEELLALISENTTQDGPQINIPLEDFDLGNKKTAVFKYPAPQVFLNAICQSLQNAAQDAGEDLAVNIPTVHCEDGYEVSIRLSIEENGRKHVASKRVNLWLGADQESDENPRVDELRIRPMKKDKQTLLDAGHTWVTQIEDFEKDWYVLPEGESTPVLIGLSYEVDSNINEDSIQVYTPRAPEGSKEEFLAEKRENLGFQWLSTFGSFDPPRKLYFDGSTDLDALRSTTLFFPLKDLSQSEEVSNGEAFIESCPALKSSDPTEGCEIELWSVVRDNRLGVDWIKRSLFATGVAQ